MATRGDLADAGSDTAAWSPDLKTFTAGVAGRVSITREVATDSFVLRTLRYDQFDNWNTV
jgi:hypothetical protein